MNVGTNLSQRKPNAEQFGRPERRTHVRFFKDSMAPAAKKQTTDEVLANLETAVRRGAEFRAVVDLL